VSILNQKKRTALLFATSLLASNVVSSGPHGSAPMLASPQKGAESKSVKGDNKWIENKFIRSYEEAGSPSMAIFWNRAFDDQISEWESDEREIVTGEKSINARDLFKANGEISKEEMENGFASSDSEPSGGSVDTYDRTIKGGSKILATKLSQERTEGQNRQGLGETAQFTFSSAYMKPFLDSNVKILDRSSIMRIMERDIVREAGAEMIADQQKIETEALVGYADLLAEILLAEDQINYLISVKEVATGRVIASFKSDGRGEKTNKWVSTTSGFQKKESYQNKNLDEVGKQLAIETMQHLTGVIKDL